MQSGRVCEVLAGANATLFPFSLHTPPSFSTTDKRPTAARPRCHAPKPKRPTATAQTQKPTAQLAKSAGGGVECSET